MQAFNFDFQSAQDPLVVKRNKLKLGLAQFFVQMDDFSFFFILEHIAKNNL